MFYRSLAVFVFSKMNMFLLSSLSNMIMIVRAVGSVFGGRLIGKSVVRRFNNTQENA